VGCIEVQPTPKWAVYACAVIDPLITLAFSLHANPGAYALLLGSGVSRAAGVPTGWEVVTDLVERVARLEDEETAGDPAAWYRERYRRRARRTRHCSGSSPPSRLSATGCCEPISSRPRKSVSKA